MSTEARTEAQQAADAAAADATAAAAAASADAGQPGSSDAGEPQATEGPRRFTDDKRAAIAAAHSKHTLEHVDEDATAAAAAATDDDTDPDAATEPGAQDAGAASGTAAAAADAAAGAGDAAAGVAATTRVKVYGQELEVPTADVERAGGVEAFQKGAALDVQLRRAVELNKTLEAQIAANTRGAAPATGTTAASPPSGEQAAGEAKAASREAMEALLESDADRFSDALGKAVAGYVQSRQGAPAAADAAAGTRTAPAPGNAPKRSQEEVDRANAVFDQEFGAIATNKDAMAAAMDIMRARMADPAFAAVPLDMLARDVGARVAKVSGIQVGTQQPRQQPAARSTADRLADRRTVKARLPVGAAAPAAALAAAGAAARQPTETREQKQSSYVAQQQARRGSNSAIARRAATGTPAR